MVVSGRQSSALKSHLEYVLVIINFNNCGPILGTYGERSEFLVGLPGKCRPRLRRRVGKVGVKLGRAIMTTTPRKEQDADDDGEMLN